MAYDPAEIATSPVTYSIRLPDGDTLADVSLAITGSSVPGALTPDEFFQKFVTTLGPTYPEMWAIRKTEAQSRCWPDVPPPPEG